MEVVADLHLRPYYGDEDKTDDLYHSEAKRGTTAFHAYATLCARVKNKAIHAGGAPSRRRRRRGLRVRVSVRRPARIAEQGLRRADTGVARCRRRLLGAHPEPTVEAVDATRLPVLIGGGPDELARAVPMLVEAAADATRTDETVTLVELLDAVAAVAPDAIVEAGDRLETVTETAD